MKVDKNIEILVTTKVDKESQTLAMIEVLANQYQHAELELARCRVRLFTAIREAEGVTATDLGRAAGVSRQRITQIKEGK